MSFGEFFRRVLMVVLIVALAWGLWAVRSILLLGFAAALVAVWVSIPSDWMQRVGVPRALAVTVSLLATGALIAGIIVLLLPRFIDEFIVLMNDIPSAVQEVSDLYENIRARNGFLSTALPPVTATGDGSMTEQTARDLLDRLVNTSLAIAPTLLDSVGLVATALINFAFVLLIATFFIVDPFDYIRLSLRLIPPERHERALAIWNELYKTIRSWIGGISIAIVITVTMIYVILGLLLGMPNALIVGVFAGVATLIPNLGVFIPLILITTFTLAAGEVSRLLLYASVYLVLQGIEGNILTPMIFESELKIPAGGLILFQLIMALAFGALGLLLAVPILAVTAILVNALILRGLFNLPQMSIELKRDKRGKLSLAKQEVRG